ncbi:hypothetical protein C5S32_07850 [ANME-1 cluster archaeon GoMg1]|nr:hypothetical protein [ANME-1 cluster archaeon GoMg1]
MKKRTIAGLIPIVVIASVALFSGCVEEETQPQVQDSDWIHSYQRTRI